MWGQARRTLVGSAATGLCVLAVGLATGSSYAQDLFDVDPGDEPRGLYVGLAGGVNLVEDLDLRINDTLTGGLDVDEGWAVLGTVGYGFESGFRTELEVSYRDNDLGWIENADGSATESGGSLTTLAIMGNLLLDLRNPTRLTPYVGVGLGGAHSLLDMTAGGVQLVNDEEWSFAFQGIVGVALMLTRNLSLTLDYRYLQIEDVDFGGEDGVTRYAADEIRNHTVMAGLRYTFASPPPPPPPVAPPAPPVQPVVLAQTSYMVFFDWDSALLSMAANQTLNEVVVEANRTGVAQVFVEGHADRSGPADYNVGLSQRRAEAVRVGLIARGIAPDEIVVRAFGESRPLVQTPDGVREPQNRRVEIILS